jgi:hypothetical protein
VELNHLTVKAHTVIKVNGHAGTCLKYHCAQYTLHEQLVREFELHSSTVRSESLLASKKDERTERGLWKDAGDLHQLRFVMSL